MVWPEVEQELVLLRERTIPHKKAALALGLLFPQPIAAFSVFCKQLFYDTIVSSSQSFLIGLCNAIKKLTEFFLPFCTGLVKRNDVGNDRY